MAVVPGLLHATRLVSEAVAKSRCLRSAQQTLATGRSAEKSCTEGFGMRTFAPTGPRCTMPKTSRGKGSIRTGDVWTQTSCKPSPPGWNKFKSEGGKEEAEKKRIVARRPKRWAIARRIKRRRFLSCDVAQGVSPSSQGFASGDGRGYLEGPSLREDNSRVVVPRVMNG